MKTTLQLHAKHTTIAFIFSLLLHLIIFLYLMYGNSNIIKKNIFEKTEKTIQETIKKNTEWGETIARYNPAPVFFMPSFQSQEENNQDSSEKNDENNTISHPTKEPPPQHRDTTQKIDTMQTIPLKNSNLPTPVTHASKSSLQKSSTNRPIINQNSQPTKKRISLAQLSQGFLNHVKSESSRTVTMLGKKNSPPTDEQIKYERYLEKLNSCLHNSFNINREKSPFSTETDIVVSIFLSVNRDGSLHNLALVRSSGDTRIDTFVLFAFRDASGSFPPVPAYLPKNPFSITYDVIINSTKNNFSFYHH